MVWLNDDIELKERSKVGRPVENPFPSHEVEEDFVVRGRRMIERYYVDDPTSKINFRFNRKGQISKTAFWSIIFIYYTKTKGVMENLQGFLFHVVEHFGKAVTSDRASISKCIGRFQRYRANDDTPSDFKSDSERNAQKKYRDQYHYVITLWEEIHISGNKN